MMPPQTKSSAGIPRELQQVGVATAEEEDDDEHQLWECRCTLLNANSFARCVACDRPKPRDSGRASPPPSIPAGGNTMVTSAAPTGTTAVVASTASGGSNIESPAPASSVSVKRGRKRNSSAGQCKRLKTLPGGRNGAAALSSPGYVVVTNNHSGAGGGGGASPLSAVGAATGADRKRSLSKASSSSSSSSNSNNNSNNNNSSGSSARDAKPSSALTDATGAAAADTTASSAGENGDSEGREATASASQQHSATEHHKVKRKAVGAALARSALARLRFLTWEDVSVDWCPAERLEEAERHSSGLLKISALAVGSRAKESGGWSNRGGETAPPTAGVNAEAGAGAGSPPPDEEAELCMGDLFPLPPPKPPRYVKKGVLAVEPGAAATPAASEPPPASPSPPRSGDAIPEGEAGEGSAQAGGDGAAVLEDDGSKTDPAAGAGAGAGAGAAAAAATTETDSGNNSDHSAATSTATTTTATTANAAEVTTTQYAMSAAARMKAYKGIFRTGGDKLKKRPRSPVASTPLHLPLPTAPGGAAGVSLASADLEERPPCGTEEYAQTEFGSAWAWGLLGEVQEGGGGEADGGEGADRSNGDCEGAGGGQGAVGGPRHRDFRLPYDVIYDCHSQEFQGEMRQLGMRSAEDAMGEFKGITSNVYLSKKVSEPRGCACFRYVRSCLGSLGAVPFVSD